MSIKGNWSDIMLSDCVDICTAIRDLKPSADETAAILSVLAMNLGFEDAKSEAAIEDAYDVVESFIGNQDALAYVAQAEQDTTRI